MHQLNQGGLVGEGRLNLVAPASFENEAGLRAVDADLLDIGIGKVLCKWSEWGDPRKDSARDLLEVFTVHRRQGALLLLPDHALDELVNPEMVIDPKARSVAAGQLGCQFVLDACAYMRLDRGAIAGHYGHAGTAEGTSG
jgi:hypothetical protein